MNPSVGDMFGKMKIVGEVVSMNGRKWPAQCSCGSRVRHVSVTQLARWQTTGTGCSECMNRFKHGHGTVKDPTYGTWYSMKARCYNPKSISFKWYGQRGVTVCDRWRDSFSNFLEDMGERPEGKTLDRIDFNKGYSKENCRWATPQEQRTNQRPRQPKGKSE